MNNTNWRIKISCSLMFIGGILCISFGLFIIAAGLYAKQGDFTGTAPWSILEMLISAVRQVIPNVIDGMAPNDFNVPYSWKEFSFLHAAVVVLVIAFGFYLFHVRNGIYKKKRSMRVAGIIFNYFLAIWWLFLTVIFIGGEHGPLLTIICSFIISIFIMAGRYLEKEDGDVYFES